MLEGWTEVARQRRFELRKVELERAKLGTETWLLGGLTKPALNSFYSTTLTISGSHHDELLNHR